MMRRVALFAVLLATAAAANAATIKTGRDLIEACRPYAAIDKPENARAPHPCRTFLQGFAVSLVAREDARRDAMVRNIPFTAKEACVRMPDFISFRELAQRIVNFGTRNPAMQSLNAADLAQKTLEHEFPCPPQPARQPR